MKIIFRHRSRGGIEKIETKIRGSESGYYICKNNNDNNNNKYASSRLSTRVDSRLRMRIDSNENPVLFVYASMFVVETPSFSTFLLA